MKILGVCGSLQAQSSNLTLLQTAVRIAPAGVEIALFDGLRELPHFNPDITVEAQPPSVRAWRSAIEGSDALLIATPEYGFSLPGALKNGVDWVIGTGELEQKIVAVTAAVPGALRGRRAIGALRDTLTAVSATIVGGEPIVKGPDFESQLAMLLAALVQTLRDRAAQAVD